MVPKLRELTERIPQWLFEFSRMPRSEHLVLDRSRDRDVVYQEEKLLNARVRAIARSDETRPLAPKRMHPGTCILNIPQISPPPCVRCSNKVAPSPHARYVSHYGFEEEEEVNLARFLSSSLICSRSLIFPSAVDNIVPTD